MSKNDGPKPLYAASGSIHSGLPNLDRVDRRGGIRKWLQRYWTGTLAPAKAEPKVFFANERTYLAWLNMSVTLSSIAIAILAFAEHNDFSQVYGFLIMPVAIGFSMYAIVTYVRRANMLRRSKPQGYEDRRGPTIIAVLIGSALFLTTFLKLLDTRHQSIPPIVPSRPASGNNSYQPSSGHLPSPATHSSTGGQKHGLKPQPASPDDDDSRGPSAEGGKGGGQDAEEDGRRGSKGSKQKRRKSGQSDKTHV